MLPRGFAASLAIVAVGCTSTPAELPWKVTTADDEIVMGARSFEAAIRRHSCDGPILHREVFTDSAAAPPTLTPGVYAFVVLARGADCRVLGQGCTSLTLPTAQECVEVELFAAPETPCPAGADCSDGVCIGLDAAVPDAAVVDGSPADIGVGDGAAMDSSRVDTGAVDTGAIECSGDGECDDGNVCTDDRCQLGRCASSANTASCDDGDPCNGTDTCVGGACTHSGDPCTRGTCDPGTGACRSDCSAAWQTEAGCVGGVVVGESPMPTSTVCSEFCEDTSLTTPVNCCQYDGLGVCRAFRGSTGTSTASMSFAKLCI